MAVNVGMLDRALRIVIGALLVALALGLFPGYTTAFGWIGIVPLATGIIGNCPLYSLLGIRTCKN